MLYAVAILGSTLAVLLQCDHLNIVTRLLPIIILLVVVAVVGLATAGMVVAAMILPWGSCWASPNADIVATVWRWTRRPVVHAGNLSAHPQGQHKTRPFLTAVCADATRQQVVVRARAGNHRLFTQLYQPHRFAIVGNPNAQRPKIERQP